MNPAQPPLLRDIFLREPTPKLEEIRISLGTLAISLGVTVSQLAPLVREGYLRKRDDQNLITSKTQIDAVPEAALAWMRTWFLPAAAKPLFSVENLADLLNCPVREVLPAAAQHDVPVHRDPALGFCFSIWAARQLLLRSVRARDHATRFDRQALLWRVLEKDPEKAAAPPLYSEELEKELARVAKLEEPARGIRAMELAEVMRDAKLLEENLSALSPALAPGLKSYDDSELGGASSHA